MFTQYKPKDGKFRSSSDVVEEMVYDPTDVFPANSFFRAAPLRPNTANTPPLEDASENVLLDLFAEIRANTLILLELSKNSRALRQKIKDYVEVDQGDDSDYDEQMDAMGFSPNGRKILECKYERNRIELTTTSETLSALKEALSAEVSIRAALDNVAVSEQLPSPLNNNNNDVTHVTTQRGRIQGYKG